MELKEIFDHWARRTRGRYKDKQWLLSKWEIFEGVEWPKEKVDLMTRHIARGLNIGKSDVLLDLGCGGGWIAGALRPYAKKIFGVDISREMLFLAQEVCGRGSFVCGQAAGIPLKSESVDRVLSYFVFINIEDDWYIQQSLLEIVRVLKKGGRALLGQLPDRNGSARYDNAKGDYLRYCEGAFKIGKNIREKESPLIKLFDRNQLAGFLDKQNIRYQFRDSFNPFYRPGEPETVDWRFDLILENTP
ncbi:MAG TPA: methyltransferase domain-containing protein [Candidatus Omnitrophota bacterium]|nr:methyltransferase domain-containing protein [Candidatus Omnitrophota bacterium]HPD85559.1 methyltransferase domain-containing protein [Candidatus Omnitrophota bacterium]HRZ04401.1 methyltransferase domain-containing protein [Candidatus Omnitrophota bacterium]